MPQCHCNYTLQVIKLQLRDKHQQKSYDATRFEPGQETQKQIFNNFSHRMFIHACQALDSIKVGFPWELVGIVITRTKTIKD